MPDPLKPVLYPAKTKKLKEWKDSDFDATKKVIAEKIGYVPDWKRVDDTLKKIDKTAQLSELKADGEVQVGVIADMIVLRVEKKAKSGPSDFMEAIIAKSYSAQEKAKAANEKVFTDAKKYKEWATKSIDTSGKGLDALLSSSKEFHDAAEAVMKKEFSTESLEYFDDLKAAKKPADLEKVYDRYLKEGAPKLINCPADKFKAARDLATAKKFADPKFKAALDDCKINTLAMVANDTMQRANDVWKKQSTVPDAKVKEWAKLNS